MNEPLKAFDDRRDLAIPGDYETTVTWSVEQLLSRAKKAIAEKGSFSIALAGGSTPKVIYQQIPEHPLAKEVDWKRVMVFWSDERVVPPDHPDSNYQMAMMAGWNRLGIPEKHIFRMKTEDDIHWNAHEYENIIRGQVAGASLDFVMLGMGVDGHTASLFPESHGLNAEEQLAVANLIPKLKIWRLTLTFSCLNRAKFIVVYVLGRDKADTVAKVLQGPYNPTRLPAQRLGTATHKALWVLDHEAAHILTQEMH